jgi:DMSO reductase anchor subunit
MAMQKLASILFLAVLGGWAYLEFLDRRPETEGLREILFWIGMAVALLTVAWGARSRGRAPEARDGD